MRDMSELERRGIPTAAWAAQSFSEDAHWSADVFGCAELPVAVADLPFTNQPPDQVRSMVDKSIDTVIKGLTEQPLTAARIYEHHTKKPEPRFEYTGEDLLECFDQMNRDFIAAGWSDGLPLVPPTPAKVEAMIKASGREPDEVIGIFEPGFGIGTVEKLAANAVMAGCQPNTMPVIIAMAEALVDPRLGLRTFAMSTGPQAPFVLVSGPIAEEIGMNGGICALGPGSESAVNVAVGRASRLIMMNIGHSYPAVSDMDTIGTPLKFSACVAENEKRNPWDPYRVTKGFSTDKSIVTINVPYGMCELFDFENHDPELIVETFATAMMNSAQVCTGYWLLNSPEKSGPGPFHGDSQNLILMAPDHAANFHQAGWSIQDVKEKLYDAARMPFRKIMLNKPKAGFSVAHPELQWLWDNPDAEVSIFRSPEAFDIFVVGGDAGRSLHCFAGSLSISKEVKMPQ